MTCTIQKTIVASTIAVACAEKSLSSATESTMPAAMPTSDGDDPDSPACEHERDDTSPRRRPSSTDRPCDRVGSLIREPPLGEPDHPRRLPRCRSRRCCSSGDGARRAATSRTATGRPACSACSRPASRSCSGSSSSSPSRATTPRAAAPRPRRRSSRSSSRRPSSCRPPCARAAVGRARLLRAHRRPRGVAGDGVGWARRRDQPLGRRDVQDPEDGRAAVERPSRRRTASGSTSAPTGENARPDRIHGAEGVIPLAALDRAVPDRRRSSSSSCSSSPTAPSARSCRRR